MSVQHLTIEEDVSFTSKPKSKKNKNRIPFLFAFIFSFILYQAFVLWYATLAASTDRCYTTTLPTFKFVRALPITRIEVLLV